MRPIFLLLTLFVFAHCVCRPSQAQSPALNRPGGAAPSGPIPSGLPALARKYQAIAKSWHPDATLVRIDIRDNFADPQKHIFRYNTYSVVLNFYSAATDSFQAWAIGPDGDSFAKPARLHETKELNLQFVDLPQAVAAAKAAGFIDNLRTASLTYAETEPSTTREAWDFQVLTGRNGPRELVLADTGKALRVAPCNGQCDTGPQIAARETSNFGAGLVLNTYLPEGVTELKPIGWTWQRQVTEIHPVQGGGFGSNPSTVGKQNAPTQYQTDYLCTNVVQGPKGYFFLTGKGTGIPQDCVLYQNAQYEAHREGNTLGIHATLPRRSGGTQSLFIGTGWTIQPYDKAECTSLKIDVCP